MSQKEARETGLLEMLNVHIGILGEGRSVKKTDLANPTPDFAQEVIFKFLCEFGYSENFMDSRRALTMLPEISSQDATDHHLELILLATATTKFFQRIELYNPVFGLFDLTCPTAPRLKTFLKHMSNFWVFANMRHRDLIPIQERVQEKSKKCKSLLNEVKSKQVKLANVTREREQLKIESQKAVGKIEQLEEALKKGSEELTTILAQIANVKDEIKELSDKEQEMDKKIEELERDGKRVDDIMRSVELKKDLESELSSVKSEYQFKEIELQKRRKELQEYKTKVEEFAKFLQELQAIGSLAEKIKKDQQSLEKEQVEHQELKDRMASVKRDVEQLQSELKTVQTQHANKVGQWVEKKACMEKEFDDYQEELEKQKRRMTEEEIASSSLEKDISKATTECGGLKEEIAKTTEHYRNQIKALIEAYKKFEEEAKVVAKVIEDSMSKVQF